MKKLLVLFLTLLLFSCSSRPNPHFKLEYIEHRRDLNYVWEHMYYITISKDGVYKSMYITTNRQLKDLQIGDSIVILKHDIIKIQ